MIITVGGSIGSGKSTLTRRLSDHFNLPYYSVGIIMRQLAEEKNVSLEEFGAMAESDPSIDKELDNRQKEIAKTSCVIDSRLGAYMLDPDFAIWLDASPEVEAKRVAGRDGVTVEKARELITERRASEAKRYKEIYDINLEDRSVYDFVLGTDDLTKDEVFEKCLDALKSKGL